MVCPRSLIDEKPLSRAFNSNHRVPRTPSSKKMTPRQQSYPLRLDDLKEFRGNFSWDEKSLQDTIKKNKKNYRVEDPSTWPLVTSVHVFPLLDGKKYDGTRPLPGGIVAFDNDLMRSRLPSLSSELVKIDYKYYNRRIHLDFFRHPFHYNTDGRRSGSTLHCKIITLSPLANFEYRRKDVELPRSELELYKNTRGQIMDDLITPPVFSHPQRGPCVAPPFLSTGATGQRPQNASTGNVPPPPSGLELEATPPPPQTLQELSVADEAYANKVRELEDQSQKHEADVIAQVEQRNKKYYEERKCKEQENKRADKAETSLKERTKELDEARTQLGAKNDESVKLEQEKKQQKEELEARIAKQKEEFVATTTELKVRIKNGEAKLQQLELVNSTLQDQVTATRDYVIMLYQEKIMLIKNITKLLNSDGSVGNESPAPMKRKASSDDEEEEEEEEGELLTGSRRGHTKLRRLDHPGA
jgi:hypothetical protein